MNDSIVFNITVKVEKSIVAAWLNWIREEIAPDMIGTSCFTKYSILKLLEIDDGESSTYALQFLSGQY